MQQIKTIILRLFADLARYFFKEVDLFIKNIDNIIVIYNYCMIGGRNGTYRT